MPPFFINTPLLRNGLGGAALLAHTSLQRAPCQFSSGFWRGWAQQGMVPA
ncbi:hypothetical protein [Acetobacter pasteurianus]